MPLTVLRCTGIRTNAGVRSVGARARFALRFASGVKTRLSGALVGGMGRRRGPMGGEAGEEAVVGGGWVRRRRRVKRRGRRCAILVVEVRLLREPRRFERLRRGRPWQVLSWSRLALAWVGVVVG